MMTAREYLLSRLDWRIAQDEWVQAIMGAGAGPLDGIAQRIEDIRNSEDFEACSMERIAWYERALGIGYIGTSDANRRAAVKAYWIGDGKPSVESVERIAKAWTGVRSVNVTYNSATMTMTVAFGRVTNIDAFWAAKLAIRRHIPAHVALNVAGDISYLTISEMDAKTIDQTGGVYLGQFES